MSRDKAVQLPTPSLISLERGERADRFLPLLGIALAILAAGSILVLPSPLNLVVIPAIAAGLALLRYPWLGVTFLVLSVPVQDLGAVAVGGVVLTATKAGLAAVFGLILIQLLTRKENIPGTILMVPFGVYLLAMLVSIIDARDFGAAVAELYRWSVAFLILITALYALRTRRSIVLIVVGIGAAVMTQVGLGLAQTLLGLGPASFAIQENISRSFGTFGKPNSFAGYLEMTTPLLLALAWWGVRSTLEQWRTYTQVRPLGFQSTARARQRLFLTGGLTIWFAGTGLVGLVGIGTSFSRGAWLGIAAGLLVMLVFAGRGTPLIAGSLVLTGVLILGSGGIDYAPAVIRDRYDQLVNQLGYFDSRDVIVTDENFATVERMAHWQTGIAMFQSDPWTGVGAGNFNARYRDFAVHPGFPVSRGHAHNYYIHAAAETGVIGLTAYLSFMFTALLLCMRTALRAPDNLGRCLGLGAVGVTVAVMVHNIVENLHVLNLGIQLSAIWALAIAGGRLTATDSSRPTHVETKAN